GGLPLTFKWSETSGAPVTLSAAGTSKPTFTAPATTEPIKLTFQLSVSDGAAAATDTVDIVVNPGGTMGNGGGSTTGSGGGAVLMASGGSGCGCTTAGSDAAQGGVSALLGLA